MKKLVILLFMIVALVSKSSAQTDPVLAGMIINYTNQAEKELKNQEKVMLMQTTGHIWLKEEVEGTTDLHKEFNNYLSSFRSIVSYAAQIYGFYYEIDKLMTNMNGFSAQLNKSPGNAVAVALSPKRNAIYRDLLLNSIEVVNDIRLVCLSDNKMTEKERVEIVFAIRPKLKKINKKLQRLTLSVKYTSLSDIWYEIDEGSKEKADKKSIADDCFKRWRRKVKQ